MNGDESFRLGLGTAFQNSCNEAIRSNVTRALELGYRHIDTAQAYENAELLGDVIERSSVDRDEITLATKIHSDDLTYDGIFRVVDEQLRLLSTDYVDILYVHWPAPPYDPETTFRAFSELKDDGRIRNIGVCNFSPELLYEASEYASIFAHQFEFHPLLNQAELAEVTRNLGMWIVAHTPLARGEVTDVPTLSRIAKAHDRTEAQVALAWLLSKERVAAIPKATGTHLVENLGSLSGELNERERREVDEIQRRHRFVDHSIAPWNA